MMLCSDAFDAHALVCGFCTPVWPDPSPLTPGGPSVRPPVSSTLESSVILLAALISSTPPVPEGELKAESVPCVSRSMTAAGGEVSWRCGCASVASTCVDAGWSGPGGPGGSIIAPR